MIEQWEQVNIKEIKKDYGKADYAKIYDDLTGEYLDTANGIIHYDHKGGAHIVPSRP